MVYNWISIARSRLSPAICLLCGHQARQDMLCQTCRETLPLTVHRCRCCAIHLPDSSATLCGQCISQPPAQDAAFSAFRYQAPVKALLHDLKYRHRLHLSNWLADRFCEALRVNDHPINVEGLIPVPLHPRRQRLRGFNQATELARRISRQLDIPLLKGCLQRCRNTPKQTGLNLQQRKRNLRHAFQLNSTQRLPERVALVDDVITTGSTMRELAALLKQNGVQYVEIWSIARAEVPD